MDIKEYRQIIEWLAIKSLHGEKDKYDFVRFMQHFLPTKDQGLSFDPPESDSFPF